jgi:hypothetical protein
MILFERRKRSLRRFALSQRSQNQEWDKETSHAKQEPDLPIVKVPGCMAWLAIYPFQDQIA